MIVGPALDPLPRAQWQQQPRQTSAVSRRRRLAERLRPQHDRPSPQWRRHRARPRPPGGYRHLYLRSANGRP